MAGLLKLGLPAPPPYNPMVGLNNYCTRNKMRATWQKGPSPGSMTLKMVANAADSCGAAVEVHGEGPNEKEAKMDAAKQFLQQHDSAALQQPVPKKAKTKASEMGSFAPPSSAAAPLPHEHPKNVLHGMCMKFRAPPDYQVDTHGVHPAQCKNWTATVKCNIPDYPIQAQASAPVKKDALLMVSVKALAMLNAAIQAGKLKLPDAVPIYQKELKRKRDDDQQTGDLGGAGADAIQPYKPGEVVNANAAGGGRSNGDSTCKWCDKGECWTHGQINKLKSQGVGDAASSQGADDTNTPLARVLGPDERAPGESRPPAETFGYSLATCRPALSQYLERRGVSIEIPVGPGELRHFKASLEIELPQIGKVLKHHCEAGTKKEATLALALCFCADLCQLGELPPFQTKAQAIAEGIPPIPMGLAPGIEEGIDSLLKELDISDVTNMFPQPMQGQSLLLDFDAQPWATAPETVDITWSAPEWGRNPWRPNKQEFGLPDELEVLSKLQMEQTERDTNPAYAQTRQTRQSLPISYMTDEILDAIEQSPVTLISGSTGCGKTTQLPQMLLERAIARGDATRVNVLCTQPRRIAAITVAERVAMERGEPLGQSVGYYVRFSQVVPRGYASVCYMTTGMLLRWMTGNGLRGVTHLLVDEVHERDLYADFLLTIIKLLVQTCPGLHVILMSATIDTTKWSGYFGAGFGKTVEIPGRLHPVDVFYLEDVIRLVGQPKGGGKGREDEELVDLAERLVVRLVDQSSRGEGGAILVFLPGWETINSVSGRLKQNWKMANRIQVHLLHSQVPKEEQQAAFHVAKPPCVKVVLSTNIAESSVTISDVVYVVDACQQKTQVPLHYSGDRTAYKLTNMPAAKQNLIQRAGRAGRVRKGVCYRLISRATFERLPESLTPEMLSLPLHQVTLMLKALNLGGVAEFLVQAPDPPSPAAVIKAVQALQDLKALDAAENITALGVKLARLPVEPRMGFALMASCLLGLAEPMAVLGALAASPSLHKARYQDGQKTITTQDTTWISQQLLSDHHDELMTCYKVWSMPQHSAPQFCHRNWIDYPVLKKVTEAKDQTLNILGSMGFGQEATATCAGWISELGTPAETEDHRKHWSLLTFLLSFGLEHFAVRRHSSRKVWIGATKQSQVAVSQGIPEVPNQDPAHPFFLFASLQENQWSSACRNVSAVGAAAVILGAARELIYAPNTECVMVDGWAPVKLPYKTAARLAATRAALRVCLLYVAKDGIHGGESSALIDTFRSLLAELCLPIVPEEARLSGILTSMNGADTAGLLAIGHTGEEDYNSGFLQ